MNNNEDDIEVEMPTSTKQAKPLDDKAMENFYNNPNAIYVKLEYLPEEEKFKFEVKNELAAQYTEETVPHNVISLFYYVRGMVEIAMNDPGTVCAIGKSAINQDYIASLDDLIDEQKKVLRTMPTSSTIN